MIHECMVIDNSNFFIDGTIRVRIKAYTLDNVSMRDLSIDPGDSISKRGGQRYETYKSGEKEFKYDDENVIISTFFGGAYDYGVFMLPQPNTWGIVGELGTAYEENDKYKYVWLGSIPKINEVTKTINIPSDKLDVKNGYNENEMNLEDPYSGFVFKQKETHIEESAERIDINKSKESLNWKNRPLQNMVVINKNKIWIVHNDTNDKNEPQGQSQLIIDKDGINITYNNTEANSTANFMMNKDGSFDLKNENLKSNIINTLSADDSSITLSHQDKKTNSGLFMGKDHNGDPALSLNFKNGNDKVATEIVMNSNGMTINSNGNISINPGSGGDVTLGTGGGYIMTSQAPGTFSVDNHVFTAVKSAKA